VSPVAFLPSAGSINLTNPDAAPGVFVPKDPSKPAVGNNIWTIPIPVNQIVFPGGDLNLVSNLEYRITIVGPVALAPFVDAGVDPIVRPSQLQIASQQFTSLLSTPFGCPTLDPSLTSCTNSQTLSQFLGRTPSNDLNVLSSTNWKLRMSTGLELQMFLPVINAPFRVYWAYNPLRLDTPASALLLGKVPIVRSMFPPGGAGDFTYNLAKQSYAPSFILREPRKTFRFTVATTF